MPKYDSSSKDPKGSNNKGGLFPSGSRDFVGPRAKINPGTKGLGDASVVPSRKKGGN